MPFRQDCYLGALGRRWQRRQSRDAQDSTSVRTSFAAEASCSPASFQRVEKCRGRDLNPHVLRHPILSRARLPFRHPGAATSIDRGSVLQRAGSATNNRVHSWGRKFALSLSTRLDRKRCRIAPLDEAVIRKRDRLRAAPRRPGCPARWPRSRRARRHRATRCRRLRRRRSPERARARARAPGGARRAGERRGG